MTTSIHRQPHRLRLTAAALAIAVAGTVGACSSTPTPSSSAATSPNGGASAQVLPVGDNPITNTSTASGLAIDSVLVENNTDPTTNKATNDHLEIALTNTTAAPLTGIEIFTTFTDPTTNTTENYYLALPSTFTIEPGASRTAHFDNTGAPDHFPVNDYGIYAASPNALDVTVTVSANGVAVQTATAHKDAGGSEQAD